MLIVVNRLQNINYYQGMIDQIPEYDSVEVVVFHFDWTFDRSDRNNE